MSSIDQRQLELLRSADQLPLMRQLRRGIEKESLRIGHDGRLAQSSHPEILGSALTHPRITTDFSEALLEFITPVSNSVEAPLAELDRIHRYVYHYLADENLWVASMPCVLGRDDEIPVARYGRSNSARMKTLYRVGLGHRYGRHMQTIAGIHYNFSLPEALWPLLAEQAGFSGELQDFITERYFGLIRNFRRWSWLLLYLFGASPAVCKTFLDGREHQLQELDQGTVYLPYATSLRMGDLGYQSNAQENLPICYNCLDNYVQTLRQAILEPHPAYEAIGVQAGGEYRQLSTGLLQIENEFYSTIRPKRVTQPGETPLTALARRGVEYIEVRCLDLNPYLPLGLDAPTTRFLDAFLLYCLLADSPLCDAAMRAEIRDNQSLVVNRGRDPQLALNDAGQPRLLRDWAGELLTAIKPVASLLDEAHKGQDFAQSWAAQREALTDPERTPSARILADLRRDHLSFFRFAMNWSERHAADFRQQPLSAVEERVFADEAAASLARQKAMEATEQESFEHYLAHYFEQYQAL